MFNPMSGNCYAVTRIADIQLYTDGEGTPTPDQLVDPHAPDEAPETEPDTGDTAAPDTTTPDGEEPTETDAPKKGCGSALSSAIALTATACAAAVCVGKKKED
jgi:hypothetical protein